MHKREHSIEACFSHPMTIFAERIAIWSGVIISITLILLISLMHINGADLSVELFFTPISLYLYSSWFFLFLTIIFGLCSRRQCALHDACEKSDRRFDRDYCIINFLPVLFSVGVIFALLFAIGATNPLMKRGEVRSDRESYGNHWMMMKNFHDFGRNEICPKVEKTEKLEDEKSSHHRHH